MEYLVWLEKSLSAKLAEKPIGEPVALRAYLRLTSDHGLLVRTAAAAAAIAGRWLGSSSPAVYAQGGPEQGYVTVLASFPGGQTALLNAESIRGEGGGHASVTLLLIGNHGTIEFSDHPGADTLPVDLSPPGDAGERRLAAQIEQSLREGKPVGGAR